MEFIIWLNSHIFLLAIVEAFILITGILIAFRNAWQQHIGFIFIMLVSVLYFFVTPLYFWYNGVHTIIGTDIFQFFGLGIFLSIIGLLAFIIGYWSFDLGNDIWKGDSAKVIYDIRKPLLFIFYALFIIVFLNMALGGINVWNLFIGDEITGLGARGFSYFLQNFADSLISLLILAYLFRFPKRTIVPMFLLSFFLFSLLGFRYRIILTLFGIAILYLLRTRITFSVIRNYLIGFLLFFYLIMFSTVNRYDLISKNYSGVVFNPADFDFKVIFAQSRSAIADIAIYKLFNNPYKMVSHEYGVTMFGYVFIRMIPRSIYPDKDRFYPPPQAKITLQAYDAYWARFSGEATSNLGSLYIAYGWFGIILFQYIWGFLLKRATSVVNPNDPLSMVGYIILILVSFQWITRGYMPQIIDHFVYMMLPVWLLRRRAKKIKV
jgi:hypothetical protein